mmetsp:Transcript_59740/g.118378  ORF Transcript_59740/g.118378 Transcript_59740/m.118378 type:complete len:82 (+) Transcript_59740:77-322(+)
MQRKQQYQQQRMSIIESTTGMVACASARETCDCAKQLILDAMSIVCRCQCAGTDKTATSAFEGILVAAVSKPIKPTRHAAE